MKADLSAINYLRFPMAFAVVLLHTGSQGTVSPFPIYRSLCILFPNGICQLAVPTFFLTSGYLFFNHLEDWNTHVWTAKLKRRGRSLLLPYVLWNVIAAIAFLAFAKLKAFISGSPVSLTDMLSEWKWWHLFWDCDHGMPLDFPLWFIRDLMVLVLLTPLLYFTVKHLQLIGLAIVLLCFLIWAGPWRGLFYFYTGAWIKINHQSIIESFKKIKTPLYSLSLLFLIARFVTFYNHPVISEACNRLFLTVGVPATFLLAATLSAHHPGRCNTFLAKSSFFIFAAHAILVLNDFAHFITLHTIPGDGDLHHCIVLFLKPVLATGICLLIYYFLGRTAPRTLRVLIGNR